jgi:hypothetical protein
MKKGNKFEGPSRESLREIPEVDFSRLRRGRRGKYAHLVTGESVHAVVIDPAVWPHFRSAKAVNAALKLLVRLATKAAPTRTQSKSRTRRAA